MSDAEVIAMVLPEDSGFEDGPGEDVGGRTTVLVREPDGSVALETVRPNSALSRLSAQAGCFRRRAPIIDPISRQVVGYELEMVPSPLLQLR
jgi:hypothetical protein